MAEHCPSCGEDVSPGTAICPSCDFILDASFLDDIETFAGAAEDTDPGRGSQPPQRFASLADSHESPTRIGSSDEDIEDYPTFAGSPDDVDDESMETLDAHGHSDTQNTAPRQSPASSSTNQTPITQSLPPPDRKPSNSRQPEKKSSFQSPQTSAREDRPPRTSSSSAPEDLLGDYENLFKDSWKRFMSIPAPDKMMASGIVLAMLSLLLPWRVLVFEDGTQQIRAGIAIGGFIHALLAGGIGAISWMRFNRSGHERIDLLLTQSVLASLALLWSLIAFLIGLRIGATAPDFGTASAGPSYGVVFSIFSWLLVCAGAGLILVRALGTQSRGR